MNAQKFIDAIKSVVVDSSIQSVGATLIKPAGRAPDKRLVQISEWYNLLSPIDKDMLLKIVKEAVDTSVFGFLCVLDGVRAIENNSENGALNLYFEKDGERQLINDPQKEYLHDLFNSL